MPFKSKDEKTREKEIMDEIKQITTTIEFKNEVDQEDFKAFLEKQLYGELDIDLPDPQGVKIHDEQLNHELDPAEKLKPIPQIQKLREQKKHVEEELQQLQKRKKDLELLKKKEALKKQVEKLEAELAEAQREEAYLTDKKDKEGLVKLRKEKYNKKMDDLDYEEYQLKELLEKTKDKDEIKIIKEALKNNSKKKNGLRMVKFQTYFQNAMVKIPRWINKGTTAFGELGDGLSKMGGDLGKAGKTGDNFGDFEIGDDPFDLTGGKKKSNSRKETKTKKSYDFGDFEIGDNPFDLTGGKKKSAPRKKTATKSKKSKKTKKTKKTKRKSKPKKNTRKTNDFGFGSFYDY